jgi:tripartite-type tricarboxylate transporter receptor subunit TctC
MLNDRIRPLCAAALSFATRVVFGACLVLPTWAADSAADFPRRPIRIVVPFQTGGLPDLTARLIGPKLFDLWKQPVVVENRPGAGGILGTDIVAKASPDGHTLLMPTSGHAALPAVTAKLPFDPLKDFAPITMTANGAYALVVPPSLGVKSVKELIALAKAKPGQLNFGSAGTGSGTHFAAELFRDLAKIDAVHVAYKGIPDALTDTMSGRIQFFMPPLVSAAQLAKDGRLLVLAVSQRVPGYEDIPTLADSGLQGYQWSGWSGLLAPAKTPRAIINKLHDEVARILILPEVKQRMAALGADTTPTTPEEFGKLIADQIRLTTSLARRAGIKPQ